ncbi:MAG: hypothetical protein OHK0039_47800 [Bacteroidia bacterium]
MQFFTRLSAALAMLAALLAPAQAQPVLTLDTFLTGFDQPVDIAHAGDERLFVVEKFGKIWIVDTTGQGARRLFLDIGDRIVAGGERGLLGLAFAPDYATSGVFYVAYNGPGSSGGRNTLARYRVSSDPDSADSASGEVLLQQAKPHANHNGSDLAFGPDGYLYMSLGDGGGGGDPNDYGQNPQTYLGKMLRLDVSDSTGYRIPPTNPFVGDPGVWDEIWALGLRNPWRFSFDRLTGDLWIGDVGQGGYEEIDFQPAASPGGENYGWRCMEGEAIYNPLGCGTVDGYTLPAYAYDHTPGRSVTGGYVYRGQRYPALAGYYVFGDYASGRCWTLHPRSGLSGWDLLFHLQSTANNLSCFGEDASGELYAAGHGNGVIYRIGERCFGLTVQATLTAERCPGTQDGRIDLALSGGRGSYEIAWAHGPTALHLDSLAGGTYTVEVGDAGGCLRQLTLVLPTTPIPQPAILGDSVQAFCLGSDLVLRADAVPPGYHYRWLRDGLPLPGDTAVRTVGGAGVYTLALDGPCPADSSAPVFVTALDTPLVQVSVAGDSLLAVGASGDYQWFWEGEALPGATQAWLVPERGGLYSVAVRDPAGCVGRAAIQSGTTAIDRPAGKFLTVAVVGDRFVLRAASLPAGTWQVACIDMQGRSLHSAVLHHRGGAFTHELHLPGLAPGVYLMRLGQGGQHDQQRLLVLP